MSKIKKFEEYSISEKKVDEPSDKEVYAVLDEIAKKIAKETGDKINSEVAKLKFKMPHKQQYVLEEIIKHLQAAV